MIFLRISNCLLIACILSSITLSGCVATREITGVEPIYPPLPIRGLNIRNFSERVDTLTPTFKWAKYEKSENVTYDFAIWLIGESSLDGFSYKNPVYYVGNIQGTSHTITEPLEYDTLYLWSVRPRQGSDVGLWASYSSSSIYALAYGSRGVGGSSRSSNVRFPFLTPEREN